MKAQLHNAQSYAKRTIFEVMMFKKVHNSAEFLNLAGFLLAITVAFSSCSKEDNSTQDKDTPSIYDNLKPIGFGERITGGNNQNISIVSTSTELAQAVSGTNPATVYVEGDITLEQMISVGSNKSIIGLKGATISNLNRNENAGIFLLNGSNNVIIRNLTLLGPGAYDIDANYSDNISLIGAKNVWVDHCDIQDGIDGNFDIVEGSDSICVSWTRFRYLIEPWSGEGGDDRHCYCNLIGNSNETTHLDEGHLNCTFICCWWGEGCVGRCPRVRFGKVHLINCLYDGNDYEYCIGCGVYSNIYVENCAFTSNQAKQNALQDYTRDTDFNINIVGCSGIDDITLSRGNREQFIPTYNYSAFNSDLVTSVLTDENSGAGPTLDTKMIK